MRSRSRSPRRRSSRHDNGDDSGDRKQLSADEQLERDRKTVFVMPLYHKLRTHEFQEFFEKNAGPVKNASIIYDKVTKRSKGFGYIEFVSIESVKKSLTLNGQMLHGSALTIRETQAERNMIANVAIAAQERPRVVPRRIFVGNLHPEVTDSQLREIFSPFGKMKFCVVCRVPETNVSRGFGFIEYQYDDDAKNALEFHLHSSLAGRPLRLGYLADNLLAPFAPPNIVSAVVQASQTQVDNPSATFFSLIDTSLLSSQEDRDDRERKDKKLEQEMHKRYLDDEKNAEIASADIPTRCLHIKNMFNPEEETEPDWVQQIQEDVTEECSKYGQVLYCSVDKFSNGDVYMKFGSLDASQAAKKALSGRWFSSRQLQANFMSERLFSEKFPESQATRDSDDDDSDE